MFVFRLQNVSVLLQPTDWNDSYLISMKTLNCFPFKRTRCVRWCAVSRPCSFLCTRSTWGVRSHSPCWQTKMFEENVMCCFFKMRERPDWQAHIQQSQKKKKNNVLVLMYIKILKIINVYIVIQNDKLCFFATILHLFTMGVFLLFALIPRHMEMAVSELCRSRTGSATWNSSSPSRPAPSSSAFEKLTRKCFP